SPIPLTPPIYPLSLHDALPILISPRISIAWQPKFLGNTSVRSAFGSFAAPFEMSFYNHAADTAPFSPTFDFQPTTTGGPESQMSDRKSTRLNSSHLGISYAVFC